MQQEHGHSSALHERLSAGQRLHLVAPGHSVVQLSEQEIAMLHRAGHITAVLEDTVVPLPEVVPQFPAGLGDPAQPAAQRHLSTRTLMQYVTNLDRLDQRTDSLDGQFTADTDGTGVDVYVIDSGVRASHTQFSPGQVIAAYNAFPAEEHRDCVGHGTHVASVVAGKDVGGAPGVTIMDYRAYSCDQAAHPTTTTVLITALNAMAVNITARAPRRAVVSMSLASMFDSLFNAAVERLVTNYNAVVVVAAGNNAISVAGVSPASSPLVITVGATTAGDQWAPFSNFGPEVDVAAVGVNVVGAWNSSDTDIAAASGTSMACPLVSSVAARMLQANASLTPAAALAGIVCAATSGKITNLPEDGTPNLLAYAAPAGVPYPAPGQCDSGAPPFSHCRTGCSGHGTCRADQTCACDCGHWGGTCQVPLPITAATLGAGSVLALNNQSRSFFGNASGDILVRFDVPAGTLALDVTTCSARTDVDSQIFLLDTCLTMQTDLASATHVSLAGTNGACPASDSAGLPSAPAIHLPMPSPGTYYAVIEGAGTAAGAIDVVWDIVQPTPSPSVSPWVCIAASCSPSFSPTPTPSASATAAATGSSTAAASPSTTVHPTATLSPAMAPAASASTGATAFGTPSTTPAPSGTSSASGFPSLGSPVNASFSAPQVATASATSSPGATVSLSPTPTASASVAAPVMPTSDELQSGASRNSTTNTSQDSGSMLDQVTNALGGLNFGYVALGAAAGAVAAVAVIVLRRSRAAQAGATGHQYTMGELLDDSGHGEARRARRSRRSSAQVLGAIV